MVGIFGNGGPHYDTETEEPTDADRVRYLRGELDRLRAENERHELACSKLKLEAFKLMDERDKLRAENEELRALVAPCQRCEHFISENKELRGLLDWLLVWTLQRQGRMVQRT